MTSAPDRLQSMLAQSQVTGIDFVFVHPDQVTLDVHFLRSPTTLTTPLDAPLPNGLALEDIHILDTSDSNAAAEIPITGMTWIGEVLQLQAAYPGGFSLYKIRMDDARIDRYYNNVQFSFKANCPSDLDCEPPPHECPPEDVVDFPINYLARDFWSFRRALLDFASLKYPDWKDRLEADAGIMMAELMSALGDEMAYYQDRIGREAHFETATQRRSLRRHARLIDYHIHDGLGATTWLDVTVRAGDSGIIPAGMDVWASNDLGERVNFEVGQDLEEILANKPYAVDAVRNTFEPHCWDEDDTCLPVGSTEIFIKGHHAADLPFDDLPNDKDPGKWVLLKTNPDPSLPERAHMVRLIAITDTNDPVFGEDLTHLVWEEAQATPFEIDMRWLEVRGNLVPVSAGQTHSAQFVVGADPTTLTLPVNDSRLPLQAVEREGPDGSLIYLFTLPNSDELSLVRLGETPDTAEPQVHLTEMASDGTCWIPEPSSSWQYRRTLIQSFSNDDHYTLDDGSWRRVVGYQRIGGEIVHQGYATNEGVTIRFGDNQFGITPSENTVFKVTYRLGGSRRSNVSQGSLTNLADDRDPFPCDPPLTNLGFVESVNNPLPAKDGLDAETPTAVRQLAPEAYRAITYRAVRPEDYAEAVERLPEVQRAGASFRWTGSWLSAFATPDPLGTAVLSDDLRQTATQQLNRFRQAGREAHILNPIYADLDLEITVCVAPHAYQGEVKERVLEALTGKKGVRPVPGYFSADHFTFGTPLERSTLEDAIQSVEGVRAVEDIYIRRRGWFPWKLFSDLFYQPGMNAIIRVENDPLHPERGTIKLKMEGGA